MTKEKLDNIQSQGTLSKNSPEAMAHVARGRIAEAKKTLDIPADEDVHVSRTKMLTSPFFWMPVLIAIILTILINIAIHYYLQRDYAAMIYWALAFIAFLVVALVYHYRRGKYLKSAQADTRHDAYIHHQKLKSATVGFMDYTNEELAELLEGLKTEQHRRNATSNNKKPLSWMRASTPVVAEQKNSQVAANRAIEKEETDVEELRELIDREADQIADEQETIEEASEDIAHEKDEFGHKEKTT